MRSRCTRCTGRRRGITLIPLLNFKTPSQPQGIRNSGLELVDVRRSFLSKIQTTEGKGQVVTISRRQWNAWLCESTTASWTCQLQTTVIIDGEGEAVHVKVPFLCYSGEVIWETKGISQDEVSKPANGKTQRAN
ncbi:hypothetical protein TWF217_000022 [Orbilia oligospora]|nr:hypothetical protein TWF128_005249 [Orbilia oligospora]KAF3272530.1 hypothetical protein TWF217_000022 [Orbilia oligospora]